MAPATHGSGATSPSGATASSRLGGCRPRRRGGRSTPTSWSWPPASSTSTPTPTSRSWRTGSPRAGSARASPLRSSAKARPTRGKLPPRPVLVRGKEVQWTTLGGYLDAVERAGISVNVTFYVGLDNFWQCVMGRSFARPTADQFDQMHELVDEAMRDGAFGLSTMLMMPPGSLATTD